MPLQIRGPLGNTLVSSHIKVTANPWPPGVNRTKHAVSIQGRTPAIIEPRHAARAPLICFNKVIGHTGIGDERHFQTATARLTACAGHFGIRPCVASTIINCLSPVIWVPADITELLLPEHWIKEAARSSLCATQPATTDRMVPPGKAKTTPLEPENLAVV